MSDAKEIVPHVAAPAAAVDEPAAIAAAPATPVSTPAAAPAAAAASAPALSSLVEGLSSMQRIEQFMPSRVEEGLRVNTVRWVVPKDAKVTAAASTGPAASASGVAPASDAVEAVPATPSIETAPGALGEVKAGILFCHGYGHYVGLNYDWLSSILARHGIAAFAMEHIGHGKSEGLPGYLPNFGGAVTDVLNWGAIIKEKYLPAGAPLFIYGESLGGGMAIHCALREPHAFAGMVLFAPMVATAAGTEPPYAIQLIGRAAAWCAPTLAAAPVRDLLPHCFRDETMVEVTRADTFRYNGRMRLGTAFALKGAIDELTVSHAKVSTPFIIFHGTADEVTDHAVSKRLFDVAPSTDKTLYHYEGACHVLWTESLDTRERLLHDLVDWLLDRSDPARRAKLASPIANYATRPLGTAPFRVEGHPLTLYTIATHGHLYRGTHPRDVSESHALPADHAIHKPTHERHHLHPKHAAKVAAGPATGAGAATGGATAASAPATA